jgi:hypothetical protein
MEKGFFTKKIDLINCSLVRSMVSVLYSQIFSDKVRLSPLGTAATTGLLYQSQLMLIVEQSVECEVAEETEVLAANLPQYHFVHHKSHMT